MMNEPKKNLTMILIVVWIVLLSGSFYLTTSFATTANQSSLLAIVNEDIFENTRNNTMWTITRGKRLANALEVKAHLDKLNRGQFDDWRLPTKQELFELFSIFDLKNNGVVKIRLEGKYWFSDSEGQILVGTWEIGEGCGPERRFFTGGKGYVRAVRL